MKVDTSGECMKRYWIDGQIDEAPVDEGDWIKYSDYQKEQDAAFNYLSMCGVPKERARSVFNGIGVLVTRMDRQVNDLERLTHELKLVVVEQERKLSELRKYFTSANPIPVDRAVILAKDFWSILGEEPKTGE
jgi:hypothetical protein